MQILEVHTHIIIKYQTSELLHKSVTQSKERKGIQKNIISLLLHTLSQLMESKSVGSAQKNNVV